jgi:hypothetical protein
MLILPSQSSLAQARRQAILAQVDIGSVLALADLYWLFQTDQGKLPLHQTQRA